MSDLRPGLRPGHRVVVIGSGWAGLSAALAAREAHADVTLLDGGPGGSALGPGALDDIPWEDRDRAATALGADLLAPREAIAGGGTAADLAWLAEALGGAYDVAAPGEPLPLLASTGGRVRAARGRDAALLDLAQLAPGSRVLVPRADRANWDADCLARLWTAERRAADRALVFEAVDADVLRHDDERRIGDADLAARHDEPARLAWLAERLRETIARSGHDVAAVLLGPWLGIRASRAAALGRAVERPVGEALAPLAATAGLRFEAARDALLRARGVRVKHGRARRITDSPAGPAREHLVELAMGDPLFADAVVLAIGGLVGGGIVYAPAEHGAGPEGADLVVAPLHASVACGVQVEIRGEVGPGSSLFGPALDDVAWPIGTVPGALERAGLRASDLGPERALHGAGDALANRARTVGAAVTSGRAAGRASTA